MGAVKYKSCLHHKKGTKIPYQDWGKNNDDYQFYLLADGIREYPKSSEASRRAVEAAHSVLLNRGRGKGDPKCWIADAMQKANEAVYELNKVTDPEGKTFAADNAGTTLDIVVINNDVLHVGHIGDGRVYVWSSEEGIKRITQDHLYEGHLAYMLGRSANLTNFDNFQVPLKGCKWILLVTDGVYKRVSERELENILKHSTNHKIALQKLLDLAYAPEEIAIKRAKDFKITKEQAQLMLQQERDDMTGILIRRRS